MIKILSPKILFCYSYWMCKCKLYCIQHISKAQCYECGAMQDDRPPAKLDDVIAWLRARAEDDNAE